MMGIVAGRVLDSEANARAAESSLKAEKRQITRNRTSYSCQTCRRRKIKCDKKQPICSGCEKSNDTCIYGKAEQSPVNGAGATSSTQPAKRRSSFLSNGRDSPPEFRPSANPSTVILQGLEHQLNRLTNLVDSVRRESVNAHGPRPPPTPNSLSQRDGDDEPHTHRDSSGSPSSASDAVVQKAAELSSSLSELDISKQHYLSDAKGRFWSHMVQELEQLRYLIKGSQSFPAEQQLADAMGIEHTDCNGARDKADPDAIIDDPIDIHRYQQPDAAPNADQCPSCHVRSGDKSCLLMPRRLRKLDANAAQIDITSNLPTEAQSNVLFRAWLTGVHPAMPILPLRTTFRRYQQFWEWRRSVADDVGKETETPDMYAMPALYAIWYTGALSMSLKCFQRLFPGASRAQLCANYHDQCVRLLTMVSFPANNQVWLLAALVMLQSVPCGEEEPLQNSDYVNLMVRLAQAQGLHREPALADLHPFDAEVRRRVWWQILQLDTSLAVSSGFPTCTSEDTSDVHPISQVKEMFIGSDEERVLLRPGKNGGKQTEPVDDPFGVSSSVASVSALVARTYASIALASRKIVSMHMRTRPVNKDDLREMSELILATEGEVRAVINSIPTKGVPELGFTPDDSSNRFSTPIDCDALLESAPLEQELTFYTGILTEDLPNPLGRFHRQRLAAFHKWARIFLSMMCDKMHCIAYAPFLKNLKSKLWAGGRQCALHHTCAYLRKFISLAHDPSLEAFRWTWPGTAQPMHAAIILLVDLYERPGSVEAARSRALIDEVFALSSPDHGIVGGPNGASAQRPFREGGEDAWEMLRNLRASAWHKAGLDPNVLWTQEQQVLVGVAKPLTTDQKIAQSLREDTLYEENTEPGDKTAIRTALHGLHSELAAAEQRDNSVRDTTSTDVSSIDAIPRSDTASSRLLRLPGQKVMPFPLLRRANAQPASQPATSGAAAHIDATRYVDDAPEEWYEAELQSTQDPTFQPSVAPEVTQAFWQRAERVPMKMVQSYSNIHSKQRSDTAETHTEWQQPQASAQPLQAPVLETSDSSDQMDFAFDWDAWDAVFNQYGGFTEMLDDEDFAEMDREHK